MKAATFISAGALAIAAACLAAPNVAAAAEHQDRQEKGERGGWSGRSNDRGDQPAARPAQPAPAPRAQAQSGPHMPGWNARDRQSPAPAARERDYTPHDWVRGRAAAQPDRNVDRSPPVDRNVRNDQPGRGNPSWNRGDNDRDRDRDRDRDQNWRNNNSRYDHIDNRRASNSWDRNNWRRNDRYDWQRYRDSHRSIYRMGRYYAPYHSYSYRRIGIGISLGPLFYGSRYWIDDPWYYRLPEVYGPYRWVRYYDDVLLVNIYTGEVVDVIYDFFW